MKQALLVIAKRPANGGSKTRLSPSLSGEKAYRLYERFLWDTLDIARAVPRVAKFVAFSPEGEAEYFRRLAPDFDLVLQKGDSLGERLDNALAGCLGKGFDRAVIVDSDSPTLPTGHVARAFELLEKSDVVLGPCDDGGYYLIGVKRPQPSLLRRVRMSTPHVLRDTLALAEESGLRVSLLPPWYDVDTIEDLERLHRELMSAQNGAAVWTRKYLEGRRDHPSPE